MASRITWSAVRSAGLVFAISSGSLLAASVATEGCGPSTPAAKGPEAGAASADASVAPSVVDAPAAPGDAGTVAVVGEAGKPDVVELAVADAAPAPTDAGDAGPPACWKGFKVTGNAVADLADLGARCAAGMVQVIPPVKHPFKTGETKAVPIPFLAGCYRIIAVGGTGVKNVDLALKDNGGKIIAADMTPDDVFPMIHPNKEFCTDAVQILNLNIIVNKGAGEVAGGVWKR